MALIRCPECGKEISDKAASCPNCGYPIKELYIEKPYNYYNNIEYKDVIEESNDYENEKDVQNSIEQQSVIRPYISKKNNSILGIVALILSVLGCTAIIGFIIAVIDIKNNDEKDKKLSWYAIGVCCLWIIFLLINGMLNNRDESNNEVSVRSEPSYYWEVEEESIEDDIEQEENQIIEEITEENETVYEDVFFYTLMDNIDFYNGKNIRTVIQVSSCYQSESESYIRSQYSDADLVENSDYIVLYPFDYQEFDYGEYVTVEGKVAKKDNSDVIVNAYIVNYGEEARTVFESDLSVCRYEYNLKMQEEKEAFIESCIEVSYDDLRRYPDSYEDVPIKLTIYAEDVEPDGWIFPGDIIATVAGEELAVYDDRIVREPRIMEGDTITVYAVGYGLSTMKVKQKGVIFNKTVDEYDVPSIKIKYTEKDKDFAD